MSTKALTAGDVFTYTPDSDYRGTPQTHCREGLALVMENGSILDTFWGSLSDAHRLTDSELATLEFEFNTSGYEELDRSRGVKETWLQYAPEDRAIVTSQHGLQNTYYVRNGARPDLATKIENARQKIEQAESELRNANWHLEWAKESLAKLEAEVSL